MGDTHQCAVQPLGRRHMSGCSRPSGLLHAVLNMLALGTPAGLPGPEGWHMYQLKPAAHSAAVRYILKNMKTVSNAKKKRNEKKPPFHQPGCVYFQDMHSCAMWGFWVQAGMISEVEIRWYSLAGDTTESPSKNLVFTKHAMSDFYSMKKPLQWTHQVTARACIQFSKEELQSMAQFVQQLHSESQAQKLWYMEREIKRKQGTWLELKLGRRV